jgi:hypothetical protein
LAGYFSNAPLQWVARYRKRATEGIELAESSFDPRVALHVPAFPGRSALGGFLALIV